MLDVYDHPDPRDGLSLVLVPGTSQGPAGSAKPRAKLPTEIDAQPSLGSGLTRTTRFKFALSAPIPFTSDYFSCMTCRAGSLPADLVPVAEAAEVAVKFRSVQAPTVVQVKKKSWSPPTMPIARQAHEESSDPE